MSTSTPMDVLASPVVKAAINAVEQEIGKLGLTPQQQLAVIAGMASRQVSVAPESERLDACYAFGDLVVLATSLNV